VRHVACLTACMHASGTLGLSLKGGDDDDLYDESECDQKPNSSHPVVISIIFIRIFCSLLPQSARFRRWSCHQTHSDCDILCDCDM
jgi:hypothetical protein